MGKGKQEEEWKDFSDMTLREKVRYYLVQGAFSVVFGLLIMGVGIGIAFLIAKRSDYVLKDTMFYEGVIVLVIGILASMKGGASAGSIAGAGMRNAYQSIYYMNLEAERLGMDGKKKAREFRTQSIVAFSRSTLNLIFGGLFLAIVSQVFF